MLWGKSVAPLRANCGVMSGSLTGKLQRSASVAAMVVGVGIGITLLASRTEAQDFRFTDVAVEGNQRIQSSTIVAYTGLQRGKSVSGGELNDAYRGVFESGLFESVELLPQGDKLVIKVVEYPTINRINFEGNRRIKDDSLGGVIESTPRRVFSVEQAERDAATISNLYRAQGRLASQVTPRIIRRSDNRVDLIFEISEGDTVEVERVSFVGNRVYSDRRLRRVLETKQANFLRTFINKDTLVDDRVQFDRQILRDFYLSRGYVDFRINSSNAEVTQERDAAFLVLDVTEGQRFEFGDISVTSEIAAANPDTFRSVLNVKSGMVYSPTTVDNAITMLEQLAVRQGIDFARVEPRVTRDDRNLLLNVEFAIVRGPRIFVERIDIEGNTTTLDRVIRQRFNVVEGDPLNEREIRNSADRIRALGFFSDSQVNTREGSSPDQVIVDVDVVEQPTGSLSLGGSFSVDSGVGLAIGVSEANFLGRGQNLSFTIATTEDDEEYTVSFTEPRLLGRDLSFSFGLGLDETESSFAEYDADEIYFRPSLTFKTSELTTVQLRYGLTSSEMVSRGEDSNGDELAGPVVLSEIALGERITSSVGLTYTYDSRRSALDPISSYVLEAGVDYAGVGGDVSYVKTTARAVAQRLVFNEEVTLRATIETGALHWLSDESSRTVDRFVLSSNTLRGFEAGGIGPRDQSDIASGGTYDDGLGGNYFAVARLDAEFPLGLPEEIGLRGGLFFDIGNVWGLEDSNASSGTVVGREGSFRQVVGFSFLWTTAIGPLRFNFSKAIKKEDFDNEQNFDLTFQTTF